MTAKHELKRADIMPMDEYAKLRQQRRAEIREIKRDRRLAIGPDATLYFENYDTMWWQVHEMLYVEKGGEEQIADELSAYNPLIPKGDELVATLMFEIDDAARRARVLSGLGGVERTVTLGFNGETLSSEPEGDVERSTEDGRASSVHFLHFRLTPEQSAMFRAPDTEIIVGVGHQRYGHMAVMPESVRRSLAKDLD